MLGVASTSATREHTDSTSLTPIEAAANHYLTSNKNLILEVPYVNQDFRFGDVDLWVLA